MDALPVVPEWEKAYQADAAYRKDVANQRKTETIMVETPWGPVEATLPLEPSGLDKS